MRADMHLHSYFSDGRNSPMSVFEEAEKRGVDFICITDHDVVCPPEILLKAGGKTGVKYVPAVEVSSYWKDVKIHMLCYNPDLGNSSFKSFLKELEEGSFSRAEDILYKLKGCGITLSMEEIAAERTVESSPIHAMHIARAGAKKGYAKDEFAFYFNYLSYERAGFSALKRPSPERTAEVAFGAKALVSIAHPGRIDLSENDLKRGILRLVSCGLKGIEAVYSAHTKSQTAYYKELAKENNLLVTGGSDTHFNDGVHVIGEPEFHPSEELCDALDISE